MAVVMGRIGNTENMNPQISLVQDSGGVVRNTGAELSPLCGAIHATAVHNIIS